MRINKQIIVGEKEKSVCYNVKNFRFDEGDNKLKWDDFKFYTPAGPKKDNRGFHFFDVPADEVTIKRDDALNKSLMVMVTRDRGIEAVEIYEGAEAENISIGLEGDIVITGFIPADPMVEITVDYKEVSDG